MEKKTTIKVPDAYLPLLEDIRLLQSDPTNPNVTMLRQQEQIWISLKKYGWAYPIVTNNAPIHQGFSLLCGSFVFLRKNDSEIFRKIIKA